MNANSTSIAGDPYARSVAVSDSVRSNVDEKLISGRGFDRSQTYLLDGLSPIPECASVSGRFVRWILERIGANLIGLLARVFNANVLRVSGDHGLGDQIALEAHLRFSDEEYERQELVRIGADHNAQSSGSDTH